MALLKKKNYESPFAEIEKFTLVDIVTNSIDNGDEIDDPFGDGNGQNSVLPSSGVEF